MLSVTLNEAKEKNELSQQIIKKKNGPLKKNSLLVNSLRKATEKSSFNNKLRMARMSSGVGCPSVMYAVSGFTSGNAIEQLCNKFNAFLMSPSASSTTLFIPSSVTSILRSSGKFKSKRLQV